MSLISSFPLVDATGAVRPGVFYITDTATFARSADVLAAYQVTQDPVQHVLSGVETITLCFPDDTTAQPIVDAVNAMPPAPPLVVAPEVPPPGPVRVIARIDFLRRFTMPEMGAITTSEDPMVRAFLYMLGVIGMVDLDAPEAQQGVGYMASINLIAPGRVPAILA